MRWIHHFTLMAVIINCWGKAENTNDISEKQPGVKLDVNLRKALLKALSDLETEEKLKSDLRLQSDSKKAGSFSDSLVNDVFQKAPAATFSIITQTASSANPITTEKINTIGNLTEKPIVVIQKSSGIQHKPIISFIHANKPEFDPINDSEQIITSASSSFTGSPKFSSFKNDAPKTRSLPEKVNPNFFSITKKPRTISPKIDITTATPIITSSTEESEAKVEDVQFFAAPLVAAFTVHHDEQGLPKRVEPLFKTPGQNSVSTTDLQQQRLKDLETQRQKQQEEKYKQEQVKLQEYLRRQEQIRIQFDLEEKQKLLEQQIRRLQQQQQHQDYLLRQQQLFQEQNLLQQRQKLLEEQKVVLKNQQRSSKPPISTSPLPPISFNQNRFKAPLNNHFFQQNKGVAKALSSSISFEPSITFQPAPQIDNSLILPVDQQLPVKAAGDFRQNLFQQLPLKHAEDFLIPPQYPPLFDQQYEKFNLRQPQVTPIRDFQNFNLRPNVAAPSQSNRVFRHESGTGNFLNNDFNSRNNFFSRPQISQSNRFFRSNPDTFSITPSISQDFHNAQNVRPPPINNQLNNLLYYSGITRGNQQEDLNIVSKVLSLNHLGGDNFFGNSEIIEQRLTPPQKQTFVKT